MTIMGLDFLKYEEAKRANRAKEEETRRANLAQEAQKRAELQENTRYHNLDTQLRQGSLSETKRSNLRQERLKSEYQDYNYWLNSEQLELQRLSNAARVALDNARAQEVITNAEYTELKKQLDSARTEADLVLAIARVENLDADTVLKKTQSFKTIVNTILGDRGSIADVLKAIGNAAYGPTG